MWDLLRRINREFYHREPFKIKIDVYHQESKHIAINLYMSLDQSDELINCIETSGEISLELLDALSECIRTKKLLLQKDIIPPADQFKHWDKWVDK